MRVSLSYVLGISFLVGTCFCSGVSDFPHDSTDKLGRVGAWCSVLALFASEAVLVEKLVETGCDRFFTHIPGLSELKGSGISSLIGSACSLPVTCISFARFREIVWYFFFILYTGRRASPQLAREALKGLSSYIEHLNMLKEVYRELEQLLRSAEQAADQSGSGRSVDSGGDVGNGGNGGRDTQAIAKKLILLVQDAVASGEAYVVQVKNKFEVLGIYQLAQLSDEPVQKSRAMQEEATRLTHLAIDLSALDRLVRDLLSYWNSYLSGLVSTIDAQVSLCQNVYAVEQFIITMLRKNLVPVSIVSTQKPGSTTQSSIIHASSDTQKPTSGSGSINPFFGQKGLVLAAFLQMKTDSCFDKDAFSLKNT